MHRTTRVSTHFKVFANGNLVGDTPLAVASSFDCGSDPVACSADPRDSHAQFVPPAGNHLITIATLAKPSTAGSAYIRLDPTAVNAPEPATAALIGATQVGLSLLLRRH